MNRKIGNTLILLGLLLLLGAGGLTAYNIWDGIRAERASQHIIQEMDIGQDLVEALDLTLPVMDRWDYTRLKISPCVYSGSYKTDDLVICAHNYARHFSPVKRIDIGADVYLITVDCRVYHYQVTNRETLQPGSVENMIENTNNTTDGTVTNEWDLTLFTCNTGGQTRCAVRCARIREEE